MELTFKLKPSELANTAKDILLGLGDDAAVHIHPSDLKKCSNSECVVNVFSVRVSGPNGEHTVPLFSLEQIEAAVKQALLISAEIESSRQEMIRIALKEVPQAA